jgi:predicted glutamine amidotransferase
MQQTATTSRRTGQQGKVFRDGKYQQMYVDQVMLERSNEGLITLKTPSNAYHAEPLWSRNIGPSTLINIYHRRSSDGEDGERNRAKYVVVMASIPLTRNQSTAQPVAEIVFVQDFTDLLAFAREAQHFLSLIGPENLSQQQQWQQQYKQLASTLATSEVVLV